LVDTSARTLSPRASAAVSPFRAREREVDEFPVVFYVGKSFWRKTAQFCVTRCESEMAETPASARVRKPMKTLAKTLS